MLDAQQTVDVLKLRFYVDWMYNNHVYDEGESGYHKDLTTQITEKIFDQLNIPKDAHILDLGCGPGYFLDEIKARGYTNYTGVTLSPGDIALCESKGHRTKKYDLSFLPQQDGYYDESVDFIFLRHALEHSPYPIISLIEYNRILKQNALMYIELPAPDCDRKHEYNKNHYSILGTTMINALLDRTGFGVKSFNMIEFDLNLGKDKEDKDIIAREKFYSILVQKTKPLDIK